MSATHRISSKYTGIQWKALTASSSVDWSEATGVLKDRIKKRFLDAGDVLDKSKDSSGYGFAILAIDFAVAETIQAFRSGITQHRGQSKNLCCEFIKTLPEFMICQPTINLRSACAEEVYNKVRCAIHHSASTDPGFRVKVSGDLFEFSGKSLISVNRRKLHSAVKSVLSSYLQDVQKESSGVLRGNFVKKMNYIAAV